MTLVEEVVVEWLPRCDGKVNLAAPQDVGV
jgi:hypothetical protein